MMELEWDSRTGWQPMGRGVTARCRERVFWLVLAIVSAASTAGGTQPLAAPQVTRLTFDQKLGMQVDLSLPFKDEQGKSVTLGDYFGRKPVILDLGYYECPMLCTLVLNGLVQSLQQMQPSVSRDFDIVCVSISPTEDPALAAAKKRTYLKRYNREGAEAGWHFLTGQERAIRGLADQVGFHYAYDPSAGQYAHPSGIIVLTPDGKVARYFFGVAFPTADLSGALADAGSRRVGSPVKQLLILCFQHLPLIGKYSGSVMLAVRIGAVAVVLALLGGIMWMLLRQRGPVPLSPAVGVETKQP
jgi:protein SCO1